MLRLRGCLMGRAFLSHTPVWGATGTVRMWREGKNFGFIDDDETGRSMFVHADDCVFADPVSPRKCIAEGERVEFKSVRDTKRNDGSKRCTNVTLVGGASLPAGPFESNQMRRRDRDRDPARDRARDPPQLDLAGKRGVAGSIASIRGRFGFIQIESADKPQSIFFHASGVVPGATLSVGDRVTFDIVLDEAKNGKQLRGCNVGPAPAKPQ